MSNVTYSLSWDVRHGCAAGVSTIASKSKGRHKGQRCVYIRTLQSLHKWLKGKTVDDNAVRDITARLNKL